MIGTINNNNCWILTSQQYCKDVKKKCEDEYKQYGWNGHFHGHNRPPDIHSLFKRCLTDYMLCSKNYNHKYACSQDLDSKFHMIDSPGVNDKDTG